MSASDCRTLNIYRVPMYQKRTSVVNNPLPSPHTRSPSSSPNRSVLSSARRHSTPPGATNHFVNIRTSPSNTSVRYHHSQPRTILTNQEKKLISNESIKSSPSHQPISLGKRRHQDERFIRIVTTPTSVKSFTDIVLPMAKKNRNNIVEITSSSNPSDMHQSTNRNLRGLMTTVNLESEICVSNEDSDDKSLQETAAKFRSIRWCDARCPCLFSHCRLCHWYCSCPFCCWIACCLLVVLLFFGLILLMRFLAN